jgi:MFS transporter, putative metabolite:H+ symporter
MRAEYGLDTATVALLRVLRALGHGGGLFSPAGKIGGLIAQGLSVLVLIPGLNIAALTIAVPAGLSLVLIAVLGRETRNRDLRELEIVRSNVV